MACSAPSCGARRPTVVGLSSTKRKDPLSAEVTASGAKGFFPCAPGPSLNHHSSFSPIERCPRVFIRSPVVPCCDDIALCVAGSAGAHFCLHTVQTLISEFRALGSPPSGPRWGAHRRLRVARGLGGWGLQRVGH